jgi:hypothetical protein
VDGMLDLCSARQRLGAALCGPLSIVKTASRRLRQQAEENEYLALHDHLTDVRNRTLFLDRLRQGYLLSRPLPAPDLVRWLRERERETRVDARSLLAAGGNA